MTFLELSFRKYLSIHSFIIIYYNLPEGSSLCPSIIVTHITAAILKPEWGRYVAVTLRKKKKHTRAHHSAQVILNMVFFICYLVCFIGCFFVWFVFLFIFLEVVLWKPLRFPGSSAGKESTCNAGDLGSIPGLGRSPGEGKGYPLQYSGLENSMNCIVHGVA